MSIIYSYALDACWRVFSYIFQFQLCDMFVCVCVFANAICFCMCTKVFLIFIKIKMEDLRIQRYCC